jgi:hypothetical protein
MQNWERWTKQHSEEANYQGWNVFAVEGNRHNLEIQRVDELEVFDSDQDALDFVRAWAKASPELIDAFAIETCKLALEITGQG